jgi:crossover junction endodeoxyribonuclease RusA
MLELTLPLPPSVNTYYKKYRNKLIISPAGMEFRKNVIALVDTIADIERFSKDDRLSLDVSFYPPDNRRRDLDNFCGKALQDALQHAGIYPDDSQLDSVTYNRMAVDREWPRVEIVLDRIEELEAEIEPDSEGDVFEIDQNLIFLLIRFLSEYMSEHLPDDKDSQMVAIEEDTEFPHYEFHMLLELLDKFQPALMSDQMNPHEIGVEEAVRVLKKLDISEQIN